MDLKHLINYLNDECSEEERREVRHWINSDPTNKQYLKSLKRIWGIVPEDEFKVDAEKTWSSFKERIIEKDKSKSGNIYNKTYNHRNKRDRIYLYSKIAAAAAIFFIVGLFMYKANLNKVETVDKEQFTTKEIVTKKGEKIRFRLTDGTQVILNSDSKLIIPTQFIGESREVLLSGEAHFNVKHQEGKPFVVHSKKLITKVLGTQFVVSAYPTDESEVVAVTEGRVKMEDKSLNKSKAQILESGYVGKLKRGSSLTIEKENNLEKYTGWTNKKLIFENDSFKEVKNRVERWYDIRITVKDTSIYERHLTAKFMNEPLEEVLKVASLSMGIGYEKEKRKVTFFNDE